MTPSPHTQVAKLKKESLPTWTLFSWKTSFSCSGRENESATCCRTQVTKGSLQSLLVSKPHCCSVNREAIQYTWVLLDASKVVSEQSRIQYLHLNKEVKNIALPCMLPRILRNGDIVITNKYRVESVTFSWTVVHTKHSDPESFQKHKYLNNCECAFTGFISLHTYAQWIIFDYLMTTKENLRTLGEGWLHSSSLHWFWIAFR